MAATMTMGRIETARETWRHDRNEPRMLTVKFPRLPAIGVIDNRIPRTDGSLKKDKFFDKKAQIFLDWAK